MANEISEEDIFLIVKRKLGNHFNIITQTLEPVKEKVGLLGEHAFLNITVLNISSNKKQYLSFFVKFFPKLEALAVFAQEAGSFHREEFAYKMFSEFKLKDINIIECCTGSSYITNPNKYIILDNIAVDGYRMPNKMEYIDYNSLLVVLQSLAQLHASSLIYEEKISEATNKKYRIWDENKDKLKEVLYTYNKDSSNKDFVTATFKCISTEIELFEFPKFLASGRNFEETIEKLYPKIFQLVQPSQNHRNVLCHGDIWASNLMLKFDEACLVTSCKIVDFQCLRYVPPAHDVMSVIYLTTSREFRKKHMHKIIGIYYSYLDTFLKTFGYQTNDIIPFSDFMESCEEQNLFAVLFVVGILPLILSDRDAIENIYCNKKLFQKVFREDRSALVLKNIDNKQYMIRLKESIEDLIEACEKFN